jgi:hypothetical protein
VLIVLFSLERLARRAAGLPTARFGDDPGGGPEMELWILFGTFATLLC